MSRMISALIGLMMALATPALAFDPGAMTEDERTAFRAEVRAYLLDNPEVLVEAIRALEDRQAAAQAQGDTALIAQNAAALFEDETAYVGGNPEGDVTIVEFLDYRCGFCKKAHPEVKELISSDGNIRYIIKEFPILGEQSLMAARFALSVRATAGDEAYFTAHNMLMEERGNITEAYLKRLAGKLGLDADAVMAGMQAPQIDQIIQANYALGQAMQITGTPSFVFGDTMLRGYAPLATMQAIVADQRGE